MRSSSIKSGWSLKNVDTRAIVALKSGLLMSSKIEIKLLYVLELTNFYLTLRAYEIYFIFTKNQKARISIHVSSITFRFFIIGISHES